MAKHLERDLERLKKDILEIGLLAEEAVKKSIVAFEERDADLAREVIESDTVLDRREVEVEEECLKILALHQPVAEDLRFITAVMKMNNDLERIGDSAVHIARRTNSLIKNPAVVIPKEIGHMARVAQNMVHQCLNAFIQKSTAQARQIISQDDEVDECNNRMIREVRKMMHEHPEQIDQGLDIFTVTRRLERIADLTTNIAQDVIYLVEGEIVRHKAGG